MINARRLKRGYGMVNVDLYSAIITKVSNALNTLVSGEKPGFQTLSKGLIVLLCAEVVQQRVPDHGAMHSECSASNSVHPFQKYTVYIKTKVCQTKVCLEENLKVFSVHRPYLTVILNCTITIKSWHVILNVNRV